MKTHYYENEEFEIEVREENNPAGKYRVAVQKKGWYYDLEFTNNPKDFCEIVKKLRNKLKEKYNDKNIH